MSDFVHLHSHTMYSLLDGACKIGDLAALAQEYRMPAVAMTDHGNLFGAVEFYKTLKGAGVKPIIGCEVYVAVEGRFSKRSAKGLQSGANHLVLLAKNETGYRNLSKLVSKGYLEGFYHNPRIDKDLLRQHAEGLICLSACMSGEIAHLIVREGCAEARRAALEYRDIFGDDYFLEIQRHGIEGEEKINDGILKLHRDLGIPLVATNDSHFLRRDDHASHDVLICVQTGKMVTDANRLCYSQEVHFKPAEEMKDLFKDLPQAIENTLRVAEQCAFDMKFGQIAHPEFPLPAGYETLEAYLTSLAREGLERRCGGITPELEQRLNFELGVIAETGYAGYFLIVADFVRYARESGILAGARGSAVASLVAYALGITGVNPLTYGLFFERFLNPERIEMPDIDIDIADRDRGKIIDYVVKKYGEENVCQIITFGTLGAKAAVRDVGRVLGMSFGDCDTIAKLIPNDLKITLDRAIEHVPELRQMAESGGLQGQLLTHARKLEGTARHASVHAAGVVITPRPLIDYVPLYRAPKEDAVTTQFTYDEVMDLGLLKMDFLGLRNLTVLDDTVRMLAEHGVQIDLERLPLDDAPTYDLFGRGDTTGVFQFESGGMRDYLQKLRPDRLEDLIAMNALYRPGPMQHIDQYIARKHGKEPVTYDHSLLGPILKETHGVITYQEQVMRVARDLAGFTMGQADILRKAMGKKIASLLAEQETLFLKGTGERKIPDDIARKIFQDMAVFAGYGFNKAHSTGYAFVAYQCAYLKANYPAYFMAANLNSEIGDIERLAVLIDECRRMGVEVLPPDVNESDVLFKPADGRIRFGLAAVKNVGAGAMQSIVDARKEKGRFRTIFDLCESVDLKALNKRALESLICAGGMDSLEGHRAQLVAALDHAVDTAQATQADRQRGQISLFEAAPSTPAAQAFANHVLPRVPEWTEREKLVKEKEVLGLYLSGHPLSRHAEELRALGVLSVEKVKDVRDGAEVKVGGLLSEVKPHTAKNGKPMAFATLEDESGTVDLVVFPDTFEKTRDLIRPDAVILVRGKAKLNGRVSLLADQILTLDAAREKLASAVNVHLPPQSLSPQTLNEIKSLCQQYAGSCSLLLHVEPQPEQRYVIRSRTLTVAPAEELLSGLSRIIGSERAAWVSAR
ncbi:MAG: DNA polymerase III subunit alpha [Candidatus Handelsmanbacteria bacterium RIFCSPLOWO2_12_FULL_64_10]|uniref:DNA polymerase III subunit alpha n=1 Tax=Handelsmanbacteria sp. (strain RIFCSPLOWO2_12_FULL_64_10) TaxID=1817868 RepID=A0A1F6CDZ8_HANXR|nr:MAG: DNA polymerase III subunit alpha [Candidatus Handelsmanbacteria bacterium RIFCSPLOWO2_12_FULL_64_10]